MSSSIPIFEGLPVRTNNKPFDGNNISISQLEQQLMMLMNVVSRVKQLDHVSVKQVPFTTRNGDVVLIPGPWSLEMSTEGSPQHPSSVADDAEDGCPRRRSTSPDRFVVRNEFGHARLQQLLEYIDEYCDDAESDMQINHRAIEVGGHCVLSPDIFEECLDKGWGCKHPFAGRYHPIVGTVVPDTTLLYFTPRDERECETLWKIILKSYEWAKADIHM